MEQDNLRSTGNAPGRETRRRQVFAAAAVACIVVTLGGLARHWLRTTPERPPKLVTGKRSSPERPPSPTSSRSIRERVKSPALSSSPAVPTVARDDPAPEFVIGGRVTGPSGHAIPGADVELTSCGTRLLARQSTDSDGAFLFSDVSLHDEHVLWVEHPEFCRTRAYPSISEGNSVVLTPAAARGGGVVDSATGKGIEGVKVYGDCSGTPTSVRTTQTSTGPNGRFSIAVPESANAIRLKCFHPEYHAATLSRDLDPAELTETELTIPMSRRHEARVRFTLFNDRFGPLKGVLVRHGYRREWELPGITLSNRIVTPEAATPGVQKLLAETVITSFALDRLECTSNADGVAEALFRPPFRRGHCVFVFQSNLAGARTPYVVCLPFDMDTWTDELEASVRIPIERSWSGVVLDCEGKPLPNATVQLIQAVNEHVSIPDRQAHQTTKLRDTQTTGEDGSFESHLMLDAEFYLSVTHATGAQLDRAINPTVICKDGAVAEFRLPGSGKVEVTLTLDGRPFAADATVLLDQRGPYTTKLQFKDGRGTLRCLRVNRNHRIFGNVENYFVDSEFRMTEDSTTIKVPLRRKVFWAARGAVSNWPPDAAGGAVCLDPATESPGVWTATSAIDGDGTVKFFPIAPGTYRLRLKSVDGRLVDDSGATTVEITEDAQELRFQLQE